MRRLETAEAKMAPGDAAGSALTWEVLTARRAGLNRDLPPGQEKWAWVANSVTLVCGRSEAVLVDTFLTTDQSRMLLDWVAASGKTLTAIYVTHGHADHFFGLAALLERFPGARAVATAQVVQVMRAQLLREAKEGYWGKRFPGQIPDRLAVAEPLDGDELELEGRKLVVVDTGRTDTVCTTSLHVPSIGLIVAGDAVYNGIHPFLGETTPQSRLQWIAALDRLEALQPKAVVAGHKIPENDDDPGDIAATRQYLRDFDRLDKATTSARELYDAMLQLYPDRANPGSLWGGAQAAKAQA
jgi:glyoxylase-like metal-dependent hydrolase (beta-lactamase superfamily II)